MAYPLQLPTWDELIAALEAEGATIWTSEGKITLDTGEEQHAVVLTRRRNGKLLFHPLPTDRDGNAKVMPGVVRAICDRLGVPVRKIPGFDLG
jgi:hypothetical protein